MMDTNVNNEAVQMPEVAGVSPAATDVAQVNNEVVAPVAEAPTQEVAVTTEAPVESTPADAVLPTIEVGNETPAEPIPVVEETVENTEPQVVEIPVDGNPVQEAEVAPTPEAVPLPTEEVTPVADPTVTPDPVVEAAPEAATPLEPTVGIENNAVETTPTDATTKEDNFISVLDENGKEYRAEVVDIFQVAGYGDNNYIIYSFGEKVDDDTDKVYVSKIEELEDGTINLNAIVDNTEWEAVNNAINEKINAVGGE